MSPKCEFTPNCLATGIGSLPQVEAKQACEFVLSFLPEIPFWPQLPQKSVSENMYWQYSENLPGAVYEGDRMFVRTTDNLIALEQFYEQFMAENINYFAISESWAAGFYTLQNYHQQVKTAYAVKGQITGPISFGLQVTDENKRSLLYHEEGKDILEKLLLRKANWQEKILKTLNSRVIIFLDEPYLSAFGSAFTAINREQVTESLENVLTGIQSLTGIHCCGNTDWSILLETSVDILSFDAYAYAENLLLYQGPLKKYLGRGGMIAWGIVPTEEELLQIVSEAVLVEKLEKIWLELGKLGLDQEQLLASSLITPTCGLGTVSEPTAARALTLTRNISHLLREKYRLA